MIYGREYGDRKRNVNTNAFEKRKGIDVKFTASTGIYTHPKLHNIAMNDTAL